ncbi:YicC/YloC family endoribonuclease [Priestia koreensis]|uniref:YicC/YloC family endoribonuclease n=1 Tax=Priestia koreensis TaxID=284581 RepID=UPI001F5A1E18|nr:YicC/YloC family endoribonuclease [Priestia koreensis]MCM3003831.1 YicC family protein [Priestia koreensis]UNL83931.1 YicC family protein [Priestia koreensis]
MITSMTGFGRGKAESEQYSVTVEMKSVNHRFCETIIRMPRQLMEIEDKIKKLVQKQVKRGRIEIFVTISGENIAQKDVEVDWKLLGHYMDELKKIQQTYQLTDAVRISDVLKMEDVFLLNEKQQDRTVLHGLVLEACEQAVNQLLLMRKQEGTQLLSDIVAQVNQLHDVREKIVQLAPKVVDHYKERIQKKLSEYTGEAFEQQRVLTEIAIFADKADINEELTRIQSHLQQVIQTVETETLVGRKLDFLTQELNREINTIGAKANNGDIAQCVVEMKAHLERMKEQVQNIE